MRIIGLILLGCVLVALWVAGASAKLKPDYRTAHDDMGAVNTAIGDIEAALHVALQQCQRARAGVGNGRSGDTMKEIAALTVTLREAARRVEAAEKPLAKIDDGEPDPGYEFTGSGTGEAKDFKGK